MNDQDRTLTCKCCGGAAHHPHGGAVGAAMKATGFEPVFSAAGTSSWYCKVCAAKLGEKARELQALLGDPDAHLTWLHIVQLGRRGS